MKKEYIVVRGGGDMATGTIHRLCRCGWPVLVLETENPSAIRRKVAFCEAVFDKTAEIEGITCVRAEDLAEAEAIMQQGKVALLVDPQAKILESFHPEILIDAVLAKKNLGTTREMAEFTIALGPGFTAGEDVDCVIETMRGHQLGKIIYQGKALPNTGVPGLIQGIGRERVIHSPAQGTIKNRTEISDLVEQGEILAMIGEVPVYASIRGILRGIIRDGYPVSQGLKIADIDPRESERGNCFTISDKARCIAGSVLEAILVWKGGRA